jgi:hypothetical protein
VTLEDKYQCALELLANWVNMVQYNGTGWDDWDEGYKDAWYRPCLIRQDLDKAIKESKENSPWWNEQE